MNAAAAGPGSRAGSAAAALAGELIRRPSVTPRDAGALDILAGALAALGFTCHRLAFGEGEERIENLYARHGSERPNLCFAGHTDVVPTGPVEAWSFDPFAGTVAGGVLRGRGAVDMKGAIAAFGAAVNGTKKVLEWLEARGERLDACLVGEPTSVRALGDTIKIGRRGSLTGRLTVEGVQGHTAYPHLADNAAHRLVRMLAALISAELDRGSRHFEPSSLQISTIDIGNPAANVIPARARAVFNIRFNDLWTSDRLKRWLAERLDAVGGRYTLELSAGSESFLVPPGIVSACLQQAIRRVTGLVPALSTTGGTSDARFIQAHCPVAEFGLVGLTMHKVDEQVALADLAALTAIYREFLELFFDRA